MNESKESPHSFKVLLFGDIDSKKSNILHTIKDNFSEPQYDLKTSSDRVIFNFPLRADCSVRLDLRNHRHERTHSSSPLLGIQLVLVIFSYDNAASFDNLKDWMIEVERYTREHIPTVIIGNCFSNINQEVSENTAKSFVEERGYVLAQIMDRDVESLKSALSLALNEAPSLKPKPDYEPTLVTEELTSEPNSNSCCQCTMF